MTERRFSLDQRIVAALQVDGRCSWSRIAQALGEPERNVTRHGIALLESGRVAVTAVANSGGTAIVRLQCSPGTVRVAASALAQRSDCIFVYILTGTADCVAEIHVSRDRLPKLVMDELPATMGVVRSWTDPVLRYFRTVREWEAGVLTPAEKEAIGGVSPPATFHTDLERGTRDPVDRTIIRELMQNGRVGTTALARTAGVSEATARRRVQSLLAEGAISLRVVVDPALFGLRAEAMLFIKTQRNRIEPLVRGMLEMPYVRYAAGTAGEYQVVANIAAPDESVLYDYITTAPWVADAAALETNMVVQAVKRSGRAM